MSGLLTNQPKPPPPSAEGMRDAVLHLANAINEMQRAMEEQMRASGDLARGMRPMSNLGSACRAGSYMLSTKQ